MESSAAAPAGKHETWPEGGGGGKAAGFTPGAADEDMGVMWRRARVADVVLRSATGALVAVSLGALLTGGQRSLVRVLGLSFAISMSWDRTLPFRYGPPHM
jgi:hypothetical protein